MEDFVPLDPMGMLMEPPAAQAEAPPPQQEAPPAEQTPPGLGETASPAFSQLADRAAPGLAPEDRPATPKPDPAGDVAPEKPAGAPMERRTLMGYARDQEEARQKPENIVDLTNTKATRNLPITDALRTNIQSAVSSVYGPGYRAQVYSGGQPEIGSDAPRVGSTRHDNGHAADVYIVGPDGKRVTGDALAPLARYWINNKVGGVGLEMRGGGIHLDTHADRAAAWSYGALTPAQREVIEGARGTIPNPGAQAQGGPRPPGLIPPGYMASVRSAESAGDPNARAATSSATGLYQFTDGTWQDLMRTRPDLRLTPEGRTDPAQQERAMVAFTEANARVLQRNNIPINSGTLYAAHFLGAGGAVKALSADPNLPMSQVADPDAVKANPFLSRMSVADFRAWADRKANSNAPGADRAIADAAPASTMPRTMPSEALTAQQETPTQQVASTVLGLARRNRQQAPGLGGSQPRQQQGRNPNAMGLDGAMDSEVAELDAQISQMQQVAARDPRAAAQLASLQAKRSTLAVMG